MAERAFYPARIKEFARRLYQEQDYTFAEVIHALSKQGFTPPHSTVRYWCDLDYRQREIEKSRRRHHQRGRADRDGEHLGAFRLNRAEQLRAAGLTFNAVAIVLGVDHGLKLSGDQIRGVLQGRTSREAAHELLRGNLIERGRPSLAMRGES